MMPAIWIDTDMGFDDLAAILTVAARGQVAGLSVVAGNVPLDQALRNAGAAAAVFGWTFPIHAGAALPLSGRLVTAAYVLGPDGMPGQGRRLPPAPDRTDPLPGVTAMERFLDAGGREVLALGPLTNIARLVEARPDLAPLIRLVWMGGSAGPGNHTAAAEFNAYVDPEALAAVIAAGVTVAMVGLDCCRQVTVGLADAEALRVAGTDRALLLADLLEGYARIAENGARPMALYDPVAAVALLDPDALGFAPARLDVELDGTLTRGMTVIEWRARKAAPNALIATTADAARVRALVLGALATAAEGVPA